MSRIKFRKMMPAPTESSTSTVSAAQTIYINRERTHQMQVKTCQIMILVLFLALWELGSRQGWIDDFIFSSPSRVLLCFWHMAEDGSIWIHTGITLIETIVSFILVIVVSISFALLLWSCRLLSEILEPYLVMLNSLPKSAMAPILIVWLGTNMKTIIVAAVSVAVFGSILTLYTGFSQTDPDKIKLIHALGGTRKDILLKVLLPSSVPMIISNMKVNIGLCLIGVIIGEFLAARRGLGYLIIYGSQVFQLDLVMVSIIILCIISAGFYKGISLLEKQIIK